MVSLLVSAPVLVQSLSIQPPASTFIFHEGGCRTAHLTKGTYHTLQGISRWECENECSFDAKCLAYEYNDHKQCEIHFEAITQTAPGIFGVTCDIKVQPEVEPKPHEYSRIVYGTCQSHGMLPVDNKEDCLAAVGSLGHDIKYDYSSSKYSDVVDGCSVRGGDQLFHNPAGTCDDDNEHHSWAFRGCKCSDLNPCICKAADTKVTGTYYEADGGEDCPAPQKITTEAECRAAGDAIGRPFNKVVNDAGTTNGHHGRPSGCFWDQNGYTYLNTNAFGWGNDDSQLGGLCSRKYYKAEGGEDCLGSHKITSEAGCKAAAAAIGLPFNKVVDDAGTKNGDYGRPSGCFWDQNGYTYFNKNAVGWGNDDSQWGGVGGLCF